jgi:WhiB family redox-sensing transcriptional regulator
MNLDNMSNNYVQATQRFMRVSREVPSGLALVGVVQPPEWMIGAVCAEVDPEIFFPEKGGSTRDAKRVCMGCDVRVECLEYALERQERFGIFGGKSERERRRILRERAAGEAA